MTANDAADILPLPLHSVDPCKPPPGDELQKKVLARQLKDGHAFAFGMSEKLYSVDLYSNAFTITPTDDGSYGPIGNEPSAAS